MAARSTCLERCTWRGVRSSNSGSLLACFVGMRSVFAPVFFFCVMGAVIMGGTDGQASSQRLAKASSRLYNGFDLIISDPYFVHVRT